MCLFRLVRGDGVWIPCIPNGISVPGPCFRYSHLDCDEGMGERLWNFAMFDKLCRCLFPLKLNARWILASAERFYGDGTHLMRNFIKQERCRLIENRMRNTFLWEFSLCPEYNTRTISNNASNHKAKFTRSFPRMGVCALSNSLL